MSAMFSRFRGKCDSIIIGLSIPKYQDYANSFSIFNAEELTKGPLKASSDFPWNSLNLANQIVLVDHETEQSELLEEKL